jgi:cytochrome c biogenesis protein CcdA
METRLIVAYALCAALVLILAALAVRYANNRRNFKIRQSGRGKNTPDVEGVPAE